MGGWQVDLQTLKLTWTRETFRIAERESTVEPPLEEGINLHSPEAVRCYLQMMLAAKPYEAFAVLFLDVKNHLIETVELFRGSLTQASVYPREIVKAALDRNAASVILAHNHPSGRAEPSTADHSLTQVVKQSLNLVDIEVLDHFIIAGSRIYSFAEHGQL